MIEDTIFSKPKFGQLAQVGLMSLPQTGKVLDISCGDAFFLHKIHQKNSQLELHGIDFDQEAITAAKQKYPNLHLQVGDIETLPYPDHEFDIVCNNMGFHHYKHPEQFLAELARATKPDGKIYLLDIFFRSKIKQIFGNWIGCKRPYYFNKLFMLPEINQMLDTAGLRITKIFKFRKNKRLLLVTHK